MGNVNLYGCKANLCLALADIKEHLKQKITPTFVYIICCGISIRQDKHIFSTCGKVLEAQLLLHVMSLVSHKPKFLKPDDESFASERDSLPSDDHVTTFVFNAHHTLSLTAQRERLPIRKHRDQIFYCLENYQTLVLVGETGSGKSTQVPQYLYEWGWHTKGLIGVTEPRRVSALTLTERVASERGELIGETVGVSVRYVNKCTTATKIKYMTEGILLLEMLADPLLSQYSVIIIDEVHERNTLTDTALGLLKKIIKKRDNLRIVISSATIDAESFRDFFNQRNEKKSKDSAIILSVEGRMYPVDYFYLKEPCPDYVQATVDTCMKIHNKESSGDILAFLTGQEEVLTAINLLREHHETRKKEDLLIVPMYGTLPNSDQLKVFFAAPKGVRKIVIATNVAETSITIPGIVYVVDCGFVKLKWFLADSNTDSLVIVPVSKASAEQRAGRAGRMRNGKVYRLYTEESYRNLPDHTPPEMRRTDLCSTVLHLKALGISNILRFNFPSSPPAKNLLSALETLYALDALDENGDLTSPVGYALAEMPISPMMAKMLYVAGEKGCSEEILIIIAMLQIQSVFSKPVSGQAQIRARIAKRNFEVSEGDLITLLNVFTAFVENGRTKEFCGRYFLIYRNLKRAYEIKTQLANFVNNKIGIPMISCNGDIDLICRCITAGYFPNAAYLHHSGVYKTVRGDIELNIHPLSTFYTLEQPQWVIFCELLHTTKLFMKDLTVIQQNWLTELAPHYYHKTTVRE